MNRVGIGPEMLRWAIERSGHSPEYLQRRFPKLDAWEQGTVLPTFRQLEAFAKATYAPIGYLFLQAPPREELGIADFRTMGGVEISRPTPDLLDVLHICQQRQDWYKEEARVTGEPPLEFVGSLDTSVDVAFAGANLRDALGFGVEERRGMSTWSEALRQIIHLVDAMGILVMVSGIVGNNSHRRLNPEEFRGFALSDPLAPLVFINGADSKAAQMFTLAHEVAHLWLGESGISNSEAATTPSNATERWCNQVAAEVLAPAEIFHDELHPTADLSTEAVRLARRFKVSTLVVLRRMHDVGALTRDELRLAYQEEVLRLQDAQLSSGGGNAIRNVGPRVSKRLARALVVSTLEGRTSYTESFRLLGVKKLSTFTSVAESLGVGA